MATAGDRAPVHAGQPARLRELGYDEIWLQNWLAEEPARIGLGEVKVLAQELTSPRGAGSLDILASDGEDTYYSIEVQLGEIDASHSFRVFDYGRSTERDTPARRTSRCSLLKARAAASAQRLRRSRSTCR